MKKLVKFFNSIWAKQCYVCGCEDRDCWGRCEKCGSDMHKY